jgi:lysophospholipase L1-like esterase
MTRSRSLRILTLMFWAAPACLVACGTTSPGEDTPGGDGAGGSATGGSGAGSMGGAPVAGVDAGPSEDAGGGRTDVGPDTRPDTRPDTTTDATDATGAGGGAGRADAGAAGASDGGRGGAGGATGPLPPVTVYIAGDSTVMTYPATAANMQAGWGQFLAAQYTTRVTVSNQSIGGRTSRRFIEEGRLTTILNTIKAGDYLMVQFGTNDGNTTALYPDGEPYLVTTAAFQGFMMQFIDGARGKQAIPILVTPPPRRSCTGDSHTFGNGLAGYAAAMKTVGAQTGAAVVELNAKTLAYLDMIGCVASGDFFLLGDGTHFQVNGARLMAGFVADGVREAGLGLAGYGVTP